MGGFTVVSNRLPVSFKTRPDGNVALAPSDGGLVSALRPVLRGGGGTWVGWVGTPDALSDEKLSELRSFGRREGYQMEPVALSRSEEERYYEGACNRVLWPLLHGMGHHADPNPADPSIYFRVNRRFAEVVARDCPDVVWVHDYHLLSIGTELRRRLPHARLGFFLHIPFPAPEQVERLWWGAGLIPSLAAFDVVGFQTERDRSNFLAWARRVCPASSVTARLAACARVFGISIDWARYHDEAGEPAVLARADAIRAELGGRQILLGVDRLDYTKGIPHRLRAYAHLLATRPELRGRVVFVQLAVPSRTRIPAYERTRAEVERLVATVNERYGDPTWQPIRYVYGSWTHEELLSWYVAADVAVVTPLRDGMNLVAKEFMAANRGRGVLVLSRHAGAAEQIGGSGALLVNPASVTEVAGALLTALRLPEKARALRVRLVQRYLQREDVHRWASSFLDALNGPGNAA